MRSRWVIIALSSMLLASVMSSRGVFSPTGTEDATTPTRTTEGAPTPTQAVERAPTNTSGPTVELVDSGLGQNSYAAMAMIIVTNDNPASVGEFVTASVNFLDEQGRIIATKEQVESFSWEGQELVLPVHLSLSESPGVTVAAIDPVVSISDYGTPGRAEEPLPVLEADEIRPSAWGGVAATFMFTNETEKDLDSMRVSVVCYDDAGQINGGEFTFPTAPAGRTIRIDVEVPTAVDARSCKAFLNYP